MNSLSTTLPLLSAKQLYKTYQEGKLVTEVLKGINLDIYPRSLTAIIGSSGSGKSTLLHLLGALDTPSTGEVFFKGSSINLLSETERSQWRNREIGFVYQFHHLLPDFTALENVAMPLMIAKIKPEQARQRAFAMLESVNLAARANHRPSELSGGERQRVAIARALINQPSLVMADEPTGNLDQTTAESIFELLLDLNQRQGTAFLVVTHDLNLANKLADKKVMANGYLTEATGN